MKCFNYLRAKDPVLAAIISMGMIMSAQAIASAQYNDWEEVGPEALTAQQQLMSAPPQIAAKASGQVNYRPPVAVPSVGAAKAEKRDIQNEYVVQAGDTLPKIAMKVYGDPNRWQDLMVLNNIDNGNRIFVGQKLITVASNNIVAEEAPVAEHEVAEMPEDSESADASYYGNVSSDGTYTVKKGDTLGKIAKTCLGSTSKWQKIAKANPNINPNKLKVGDVLVIPGAVRETRNTDSVYNNNSFAASAPALNIDNTADRQISAQPWQMAAVNPTNNVAPNAYDNYGYNQVEAPAVVSDPSFDPNTAPLVAPPPPPPGMYSSSPSYSAPPPAPVYNSSTMAPPPMPTTTPDVPYIAPSAPTAPTANVSMSADPVAVSTRDLYREERYRLPDELKATDFDPYFTNINGYRGLFNTECALIPYLPTWNVGFSFKYEDLKYLSGEKNVIDGYRTYSNLHLNYTGHKFFAGVTVPFQTWEEKPANGNGNTSKLDGLHDPSFKMGYQVWKNLEGTHAVTLHVEGKFAGGNYHKPIVDPRTGWWSGGKTKHDSRIGPAGATNGSWVEVGGAYSGVLNDKWNSHLNFGIANNSSDDITKFIIRGGTDYRVTHNFSLVGELEIDSYEAPTNIYGPDGTNAELTLGMTFFNDSWQGNIGFPINVKQDWGTQSSFGVIASVNHRWD